MKKKKVFVSVGMALCMSCAMSLVIMLVNVGFEAHFPFVWLRSWGTGFAVALPLTFIMPVLLQNTATMLKLWF